MLTLLVVFSSSHKNCFQGGDRSKDRLIQLLEDRELSFVYPMLKIESTLFEKIHSAQLSNPELKEWIEANVSGDILNSVDFIQSLVTW